jgi:hypothetical protein
MKLAGFIRPYIPNSYYHIYNRGAHHNCVFREESDYFQFRRVARRFIFRSKQQIFMRCFSLLPNHYHFLFYQREPWIISKVLKSIGISYARFFNQKYGLSGRVFEQEYQCRYLPTEEIVLRVEKYILENAIRAGLTGWKHCGRIL